MWKSRPDHRDIVLPSRHHDSLELRASLIQSASDRFPKLLDLQLAGDRPSTLPCLYDYIFLSGSDSNQRHLVMIYGRDTWLTPKSFRILFLLSLYNYIASLPYLPFPLNDDLQPPFLPAILIDHPHGLHCSKYIYRLRSELSESGYTAAPWIISDHHSNYRLTLHPSRVIIDFESLAHSSDHDISYHSELLYTFLLNPPSDVPRPPGYDYPNQSPQSDDDRRSESS